MLHVEVTAKIIDDGKEDKTGNKNTGKQTNNNSVANLQKMQRINQMKKEIQSKMNTANKRLKRLEKAGYTESPAYKGLYKKHGWTKEKSRFSVKGKNADEIQKEYIRINRFLKDKTSTVRGANAVLRETAENIGIKYKNLKQLKSMLTNFFALASKTQQYLKNKEREDEAYDYNKIYKGIRSLIKGKRGRNGRKKIDLSKVKDVEQYIDKLIDEIDKL